MHNGSVLIPQLDLVINEGQLTERNASGASSSEKGVKGLLSMSNRWKWPSVSLESKILNMSSQSTGEEFPRSGMFIGGETLLGGASDRKNSDAMTNRVVDEMYKLPEAPVVLVLSSQRASTMPRSWWV